MQHCEAFSFHSSCSHLCSGHGGYSNGHRGSENFFKTNSKINASSRASIAISSSVKISILSQMSWSNDVCLECFLLLFQGLTPFCTYWFVVSIVCHNSQIRQTIIPTSCLTLNRKWKPSWKIRSQSGVGSHCRVQQNWLSWQPVSLSQTGSAKWNWNM